MRIKVANGLERRDITVPMKDAERICQMKRIGVSDLIPRCKLVSVADKESPLVQFEGQIVSMDEVNYLAKVMERFNAYEKSVVSAYVDNRGVKDIRELINLTLDITGLSLITDFSDVNQVGLRLYLDEFLGISEEEKNIIDFPQFVEETFARSKVKVLPYGVFVEHGFELKQVYNGRTFPEYLYDPNKMVASLEIQNRSGDSEYLYLPTDICSMNKAKARFGITFFSECDVKAIHNVRLPENILPEPKDISNIVALTDFNELCQAVCGFDEEQMKKLSMVVEFVSPVCHTDITFIAQHLHEFECNTHVHNDEEYGKYLVTQLGLYDVDPLLLPHINYSSFATDKREGALVDSGYVTEGFVGATKNICEYLEYEGEFADPLELDEACYETFCLYIPLTGILCENGMLVGNLYRSDLIEFEREIADVFENECGVGEEARGLMHYYSGEKSVAAKVISANPMVQVISGELYGVLECKIKEPLTAEEINFLKDYWIGLMSDDWGVGFEHHPIEIDERKLYVSFWNDDYFWRVMTEEELGIVMLQEMEMSL